jgi:hypothetical protein
MAELHERLGIHSANSHGQIVAGGHVYRASDASPLRLLQIRERIFEPTGVEVELAADHLASLPAHRLAALQSEWNTPARDRAEGEG